MAMHSENRRNLERRRVIRPGGLNGCICASIVGILYSVSSFGATNPQITRLLQQKKQKMAQLEQCAKKVNGFKIAGISTLGVTAVGIGGNIALASKNKKLNTEIDNTQTKLEEEQKKLDKINADIAAEKLRQAKAECDKDSSKQWVNNSCISIPGAAAGASAITVKTEAVQNKPAEIEKCIKEIVHKVDCVDKKCTKLAVVDIDSSGSRVYHLSQEQAFALSKNWDYSNMKLYKDDGKLEEHEMDACDVSFRVEKFIVDQFNKEYNKKDGKNSECTDFVARVNAVWPGCIVDDTRKQSFCKAEFISAEKNASYAAGLLVKYKLGDEDYSKNPTRLFCGYLENAPKKQSGPCDLSWYNDAINSCSNCASKITQEKKQELCGYKLTEVLSGDADHPDSTKFSFEKGNDKVSFAISGCVCNPSDNSSEKRPVQKSDGRVIGELCSKEDMNDNLMLAGVYVKAGIDTNMIGERWCSDNGVDVPCVCSATKCTDGAKEMVLNAGVKTCVDTSPSTAPARAITTTKTTVSASGATESVSSTFNSVNSQINNKMNSNLGMMADGKNINIMPTLNLPEVPATSEKPKELSRKEQKQAQKEQEKQAAQEKLERENKEIKETLSQINNEMNSNVGMWADGKNQTFVPTLNLSEVPVASEKPKELSRKEQKQAQKEQAAKAEQERKEQEAKEMADVLKSIEELSVDKYM